MFDLNVHLNHCTFWIIPQSACRGHSLTASGQHSSHVITKNRFILHIYAQTGLQTRHTPAVLPQSSHMFGTKPVLHICMWLLERPGKDYVRYGQLPFYNKPHKPQSQTGGPASRQVAAVTSTAWWNEMGFYVNCLSAETWDREGGCVIWVWLFCAVGISHLSI